MRNKIVLWGHVLWCGATRKIRFWVSVSDDEIAPVKKLLRKYFLSTAFRELHSRRCALRLGNFPLYLTKIQCIYRAFCLSFVEKREVNKIFEISFHDDILKKSFRERIISKPRAKFKEKCWKDQKVFEFQFFVKTARLWKVTFSLFRWSTTLCYVENHIFTSTMCIRKQCESCAQVKQWIAVLELKETVRCKEILIYWQIFSDWVILEVDNGDSKK